jgi:CubicO group peptidase (beta-lactamase class C family)
MSVRTNGNRSSGRAPRLKALVAPFLPIVFGICAARCDAPLNADAESVDLAGLWTAQRDFGPQVAGTLELYEIDGGMAAEIAGLAAEIAGLATAVDVHRELVRFDLPGGRGEFRGRFEDRADGARIVRGQWIQASTMQSFARMATPVDLEPRQSGRWSGTVSPLPDELHFYLSIRRRDDGTLGAFLRNPEANIGRFYPIHQVVVDGDRVELRDEDGQIRLEGRYDASFDRLSIYFPLNGGTYDFARDDDPASRFFPRPRDAVAYEYRLPPAGAGWDVAPPEDVGMATAPLEELVRLIAATPIDAIDAPEIHAILVARHGKLVLEEYFHGYSRDDLHGTRSASKSVTTTLVGIAEHEGLLDLDLPVYATMYGDSAPADLDPRARRMTLEHLITMTPGLACDDRDPDSPGGENRMQSQGDQPDWFRYTLELPMEHEPGEHAAYCSASPNLAGGVLSRASGESLPDFYRDHLARPLGMGRYAMNLTPTGEGYGGGGLYILPRDFLKLGQLYLDDGMWRGRRLLDAGWATTATTAYDTITTSMSATIGDEGYGYGWWVFSYPYRGRELSAFYAGGNGGQYVIVVPELDLAVAIFGGNYNQSVMHRSKYEWVRDYVVASVEDE